MEGIRNRPLGEGWHLRGSHREHEEEGGVRECELGSPQTMEVSR
jgi:hypothetical protein